MPNLNDRLSEVEAELARQDRAVASMYATLQQHVAAEVHFELADDLWNELQETWEATSVPRPVPSPVLGARC